MSLRWKTVALQGIREWAQLGSNLLSQHKRLSPLPTVYPRLAGVSPPARGGSEIASHRLLRWSDGHRRDSAWNT